MIVCKVGIITQSILKLLSMECSVVVSHCSDVDVVNRDDQNSSRQILFKEAGNNTFITHLLYSNNNGT